MKIKIAVLERIHNAGLEEIKLFSEVSELYDLTRSEILKKIKDFDSIIIKSTVLVDSRLLEAAKKLKVVGRAGTGLDNIDVELLKTKKIKLISTPNVNTVPTAEYIICLLLYLTKKIKKIEKMISNNDFSRHEIIPYQLSYMTIGIIGIGNLGIEVTKRLLNFNCKIYGYDPFSKFKKQFKLMGGKFKKELKDLLKISDVVILSASLNSETKFMINEKNLKFFKMNTFLINCARAKLINQNIILKGLKEKIFDSVAVDLIDPEPSYKKLKRRLINPLINHPNVYYSPHVAALTKESQEKISLIIAKKMRSYFSKILKEH